MDINKSKENAIEFKLTVPEQLLGHKEEKLEKKSSFIILDNNWGKGATDLIKSEVRKKSSISVPPLVEKILSSLNESSGEESVERLAFETNPVNLLQYQSIYRPKLRGLPDYLLKRVSVQDDLISAIEVTRCSQTFAFGRPRENRFKLGFEIKPLDRVIEKATTEEKDVLYKKIQEAVKKFYHCGSEEGLESQEYLTLPEFLYKSTRNAIIVGRISTEIVYDHNNNFHSFRPIDAGTIYKATNQKNAQDNLRRQAANLLKKLKNSKIDTEKFQDDEYAWIQVIDGVPVQAFSDKECFVQNFYPVLDVESDGYPITPIDRMIGAVTTHINIGTHNKLYFQYGRASHGMIIVKSDNITEQQLNAIKQKFNASINSVNASFRMPFFGIDSETNISFSPIDTNSKDMEFQYLSDNNARTILSAFQMSPDELPGWAYLSRGTNTQALSESSNEWKLQASRDAGFRPLLQRLEDFLNSRIFPLIDEDLSKICVFRFVGLDAESIDQEIVHLQQNSLLHLTYNEILSRVEKRELPREVGADFPLNPQYQAILEKYLTVGQIKELFFGISGASKDPRYDYLRDPFFFQQQMLLSQQYLAQQQLAQQNIPAQSSHEEYNEEIPLEESNTSLTPFDLNKAVDQSMVSLIKAEKQLSPSKKRVLQEQKKLLQSFVDSWKQDLKQTQEQITNVTKQFIPKKK